MCMQRGGLSCNVGWLMRVDGDEFEGMNVVRFSTLNSTAFEIPQSRNQRNKFSLFEHAASSRHTRSWKLVLRILSSSKEDCSPYSSAMNL